MCEHYQCVFSLADGRGVSVFTKLGVIYFLLFREIMDKIAYFSGVVEKTAMALVKKLSRPEQIMRELKLKKEKDNE